MNNGEAFIPYKKFQGIWIPNVILNNPKLSLGAKVCYGVLCRYSGKDGRCFPPQSKVSEELGITERQIRNLITELETEGFIQVKSPEGTERLRHMNNEYFFIWHESFDDQSLKPSTTGPEMIFRSGEEENFRSYIRESLESNENKGEESKEPSALLDSSPLPESHTDSGLAVGSLEIPPPLIRRKIMTPIVFEKAPRQRYNGVALDVINYWNSSPGLAHHRTPKTINGQLTSPTKVFLNAVSTVERITKGNYFNSVGLSRYEKIYTKEELITSIDRFKLMATNPSYLPANKEYIRRIGLNEFFYNPFANGVASYFIKCLEEEPKLVTSNVKREEEKNPQLTIWLKEAYIEKVLLGIPQNFNRLDENKFVVGANKLHETMRKLNARLNMTTRPIDWCGKVIDALVDKWGRGEVHVGHLASDYTYNNTLIRYLKNKGRLD